MSDEPTVDGDLLCLECRYNLRGLRRDGRCPECVTEVDDSIAAATEVNDAAVDQLLEAHRGRCEQVASTIGYPVDAVMFVYAAIGPAGKSAPRPAEGQAHATARHVCDAVRAHALWYFNDKAEALDLLAEWKIRRSEDVGRIVFGMVDAGMVTTSPEDSPARFAGLFVLDRLFDDPPH